MEFCLTDAFQYVVTRKLLSSGVIQSKFILLGTTRPPATWFSYVVH